MRLAIQKLCCLAEAVTKNIWDALSAASLHQTQYVMALESMEMNFWSGKNVLVTGATGLVGSWLVQELLLQKANVACLVWDSDPTSELISSKLIDRTLVINGDLADIAACEKAISTSNN
jgi:FlaA1/EpsC-like NDP-sugar epimerase